MSSTGRGPRLGGAEDYFRTPSWTVRRLLEAWHPKGGVWLEPGAGSGSIIRAVNAVRSDVEWTAVEIRPDERLRLARLGRVITCDYLDEASAYPLNTIENISVVIGNPPFSLAQEFIDQSRRIAPNADIALQLRLNFVGSEDRAPFMRRCPPDVKTLPNRPSYTLRQTDSPEYGWLIWPPGECAQGTFQVLGSTSIEERQRDMPTVAACTPCLGRGGFDVMGVATKKNRAIDCGACHGHGKVVVSWPEDQIEAAA